MSAFFNSTLTNSNAMNAGGFDNTPFRSMLDHYAHLYQGPDTQDAVVLNRSIDPDVRPALTSVQKVMPRGRFFSLNANGYMIPGVPDDHPVPAACMLIGSDADEGDVTGGPYVGNPATDRRAQVPFKNEAMAPFWSMGAGYVYETTEFDRSRVVELVPTAPVTARYSMTDFDTGGVIVPGEVYVDHIIGTIVDGPAPCGINSMTETVKILGCMIPRIPAGTLANLRP
jgi:hypothetical protein